MQKNQKKTKSIFKRKPLRFGNTLETFKDACFYCGTNINEYSRTIDHIIPECDGGIRSNDNKVWSCRSCNQLKSNLHPEGFLSILDVMIKFEHSEHKKKIGYLKKINLKVNDMIKNKKKK